MVSGPWFKTTVFDVDVDVYLQRCVYSEHSSLCLALSRSLLSIVLEQKKKYCSTMHTMSSIIITLSTLICIKLFNGFFRGAGSEDWVATIDNFTPTLILFSKIVIVLFL